MEKATVVSVPKKSKYQFFVRMEGKSGVAQAIRELIPATGAGTKDPKKELVFGYDHPFPGWAGFNLPGVFEVRKKIASIMFSRGWKWGVAIELTTGGLSPIMNKHDHTGTRELPDNTGGCWGCLNKKLENCGPCTTPYKYRGDGTKIPKQMFNLNTAWKKKVPTASPAQLAVL